ncbi:hypothetical protein Bca52824_013756 [Brassica carinata]|uniref:Reverse transcriptase zinc-binding domain-containing protein n=1 Tax=Brassica carinata TaxID=52824 RepID=A0A8X8B3R0_BRACI|nr:hypothetical protein Bca52824_013756 [Brassica carinata]
MQGCIALGINLNATVEFVIQNYRSRRYRAGNLITIDKEILRLRTQGLTDEEDVVLWKGKGDVFRVGFDTNQTWNLTRVQQAKVQWYKGIWFSGSTPKYSVMTWIAAHNRLATGDRLLQWNAQANAQCILCKSAVETRDHLFFSCPFTEAIWRNLTGKLLGQNYSPTWSQVLQIVSKNQITGVKKFLLRYVLQVSVHTIWLERNGRRHGTAQRPPSLLIKFIDKQTRNRISSLRGRRGTLFNQAMGIWFSSRD